MALNLLQMMAYAEKAESLTAKSQSDTAVPKEAMDKSRAEQIEATNLKAEAAELETESEKEELMTKEDDIKAEEYSAKSAEDQSEATNDHPRRYSGSWLCTQVNDYAEWS